MSATYLRIKGFHLPNRGVPMYHKIFQPNQPPRTASNEVPTNPQVRAYFEYDCQIKNPSCSSPSHNRKTSLLPYQSQCYTAVPRATAISTTPEATATLPETNHPRLMPYQETIPTTNKHRTALPSVQHSVDPTVQTLLNTAHSTRRTLPILRNQTGKTERRIGGPYPIQRPCRRRHCRPAICLGSNTGQAV